MKKLSSYFILLSVATLLFASCSRNESLDSDSIFDTTSPQRNELDTWLLNNYTKPYNIDFKYRYDDKESNNTYNLVPAEYDKSVAMAILMKHLWVDVYVELMDGADFLRTYTPRMIHLIGSPAYNSQGSIVLGTAEGGLKITLYYVNLIDIENIDIEELNYWYFHTMHHEFAHILHQTKNYSTDFNLISLDYQGPSWVNLSEADAKKAGYVSAYASSEPQEDFVEIISLYITHDAAWWTKLLNDAGADGRSKILQKFEIVRDYLKDSWSIDIDLLRDIVQRRSADAINLDLKTLN
jgi:substrate import-associated zinc metallohydrolase lipoprotein